jgi:hypothetical protein
VSTDKGVVVGIQEIEFVIGIDGVVEIQGPESGEIAIPGRAIIGMRTSVCE